MFIETIIMDYIKVIAFIWYLSLITSTKTHRFGMVCFMTACMLPGLALYSSMLFIFGYRLIMGMLYIRTRNSKKFLQSLAVTAFSYILAEASHYLGTVAAYLFMVLFHIESYVWSVDVITILQQGIIAFSAGWFFIRKIAVLFHNMKKRIQIGIILICGTLAFISTELGRITYIGVSILILVFWIIDENDEKKKIRELTSYAHRTREIIPSMRRALERTDLETEELLDELRLICDAEQRESTQEFRSLKDFESTGFIVMDEQLKRYLEEARHNQFELDIIVMAPVTRTISDQGVGRMQLLQIIGDMYRNANRAISKISDGRILICFGFNLNDDYEISFYDNGDLFDEYVLSNLGIRGVTTSGLGHGIADTLFALDEVKGSFIIEQTLAEHSIFTKGIRIVFDRLGRIEVI